MDTPDIAIIIPTLNEEKFIARCLDSVLSQTFPLSKMDIMVVDGGSIDKTCNIVSRYQALHPNIRLLTNPKKIQSVAFNIGVALSTAPYIVRLDAHATYNKNYIALCISKLQENTHRGNVGGRILIQAQNDSIWAVCNALLNQSRFGIGGAAFRMGNKAGNVDTVPFGAFPRRIIEKIGGMREDLSRGEDNEYNSRIRKAGYDIYYDPAIKIFYYSRPTVYKFCEQMYANGKSIGRLVYIDKKAIGIRHLIPLFFVLGLLLGALISILWYPFLWIYLIGICVYLLCALCASINATKEKPIIYILPLFILFPCIHISYGIGTISGLFQGMIKHTLSR